MMGYLEWNEQRKKTKSKPKERGHEQLHFQGSGEVGHLNHQGTTAGSDTQVEPSNVHVFREPG